MGVIISTLSIGGGRQRSVIWLVVYKQKNKDDSTHSNADASTRTCYPAK